jgi:hypothetical protein
MRWKEGRGERDGKCHGNWRITYSFEGDWNDTMAENGDFCCEFFVGVVEQGRDKRKCCSVGGFTNGK